MKNKHWKVGFITVTVCVGMLACAQQKSTATGSKPGSAVTKPKPTTVTPSPEPPSLTIACQSAVDLMITDPQGRRLGDDPIAHAHYDEIPGAYYEAGGIDDDETGEPEEDPAKTIYLPGPLTGIYRLTVVGAKAGKFSCQFLGQDAAGAREPAALKDISIRQGQAENYKVRFGKSKIEVSEVGEANP